MLLLNHIRQPVQTFVQPIATDRTARHYTPTPVLHVNELEGLRHLRRGQSARLVLLVGKHQQRGVLELFLLKHGVQLLGARANAVHVGRVDNENNGLRVGVVAAPVGAD